MALIKEKSDPKGVTVNYWIIESVNFNKLRMTGSITLVGYSSEQNRKNNPNEGVVTRKSYTVPTEDFKIIYDRVVVGDENLYVLIYKYIKGTERGVPDSEVSNPVYWEDSNGNLSFFSDAENDFNDPNSGPTRV